MTESRHLHASRSKVRDDDCESCTYCGFQFGRMHHEHDHMPVPQGAGGADTVPACVACHDLKDRNIFPHWHSGTALEAVLELVRLGVMPSAGEATTVLPDQWPTMSRMARILWAQIVRVAHQNPGTMPDWGIPTSQGGQWHAATVRKVHGP